MRNNCLGSEFHKAVSLLLVVATSFRLWVTILVTEILVLATVVPELRGGAPAPWAPCWICHCVGCVSPVALIAEETLEGFQLLIRPHKVDLQIVTIFPIFQAGGRSLFRGGWKCGLLCHVTILTGAWLIIVKYCKSTISISLWYQVLSSQT